MASKEQFLDVIRSALTQSRVARTDLPLPDHLEPTIPPELIQEQAASIREQSLSNNESDLTKLTSTALLQGWNVVTIPSKSQLPQAIVELAKASNCTSVVKTSHNIIDNSEIDNALISNGIAIAELTHETDAKQKSSNQNLVTLAANSDLGITGVDYFIASTATAAIMATTGKSRLVSLLPPIHAAVVEFHQVISTFDDLLILLQAELPQKNPGKWHMNLISGPSRTGDIENTIVTGVHGPREVHLLLVLEEGNAKGTSI